MDRLGKRGQGIMAALSVAVLLVLAALLPGCGRSRDEGVDAPSGPPGQTGAATSATEGKRGGTLHLGIEDDIPTLDPAMAYDTYSIALVHALYAGLVDYDEGTDLVPALASEWKVEDGGKSYTFTLRPGLKFSNGRALTAADFKYALERVLDPKTQSRGREFFRSIEGSEAFRDGKAQEVTGIRAVDDTHLTFRLSQPNPLFLNELALTFAVPVPKEAVAEAGQEFRRRPVGTGPFVLKEWLPGQRLELARNPHHYRTDRPFVDTVQLRVGLGQEAQMRLFENGNLDVLPEVPAADYPRLKQDPKWSRHIVEEPVLTTWYLGMNTELPPFNDKRVRTAVNYAVNRDRLVQLRNGRAVKATSILPPKLPGHNKELPGWPHDPQRARALLQEAGHSAGFKTTLWVISSEQNLRLAEGIQADLKEVGIQAEVRPATLQSFLQATKTRKQTPFFHNGWFPDYPDPSSFLEPLFHSRQIKPVNSNNSTFYSNPKVDRLLDEAAALPAGEERLKRYQEAERLILEDAPWAPLYYEVETRLHQPNVHGVAIHPLWKYLVVSEIWKD